MAPRALVLGCGGPVLEPDERAFFSEARPWGFILFARNCGSPDQLRRLTSDLRGAVGRRAPTLIDQEGGRVARMGPPTWPGFPPALDQQEAVAPENRARAMWLRGRLVAADLNASGIDVNCAPLADLAEPETHPILLNRLYGGDPSEVASAARSLDAGQRAGGVLPVLKHLPGYGRASLDGHLELSRVSEPLETLEARDFAAFRELADLPMGMTAHIVVDALDPERPATVSPAAISYIRGRIGFRGLLMTDDINMDALSGGLPDRAAASWGAGCDIVLHCGGDMREMSALAEAAPELSGPAALRADAALAARSAPESADIAELRAEYDALLGGGRG